MSCLKGLDDELNFQRMFLGDDLICSNCRNQLIEHKRIYNIDGVYYHVLYEYDDYLEGLFFRFKEQRDINLAPLFLHLYRHKLYESMKSYNVCGMASSDKKYFQRSFIPLEEIFSCIGIDVNFPLYKRYDHKQSNQSKQDRSKINEIIFLKEKYPMNKKKVLLVDDVCTTGSSIKRGIKLLNTQIVFIIAAHSMWIKDNKENEVEKKAIFW